MQACDSQSWKAKDCCSLGPRDHIFHQTVSRLPFANRVFLGSWTADISQEWHSLRSALQRKHGTPGTVLLSRTQETEWPRPGR